MVALYWTLKLYRRGPALLMGLIAAGVSWFISRKVAGVEEKREANHVASEITENHAVEQREAAATTDEEADAALDAAEHADRD